MKSFPPFARTVWASANIVGAHRAKPALAALALLAGVAGAGCQPQSGAAEQAARTDRSIVQSEGLRTSGVLFTVPLETPSAQRIVTQNEDPNQDQTEGVGAMENVAAASSFSAGGINNVPMNTNFGPENAGVAGMGGASDQSLSLSALAGSPEGDASLAPAAVPEPGAVAATGVMLAMTALGIARGRRRRRNG